MTLQRMIRALDVFWERQGCLILQPYDMEMGAGTFHPATFFGALGPKPSKAAYVQPCRRPADGRYAQNPLRMQRYYQYQVLLKPSPANVQQLYLDSLRACGLKLEDHDLRFVQDDWESPTLGAWGLGWEVWIDSLESTQFTYFQQVGGLDLDPISCEITYGLERLAMFVQKTSDVYSVAYGPGTRYGDLHAANEREGSAYNFEHADIEIHRRLFTELEREAHRLLDLKLLMPAYEQLLKSSHTFNLLDARGAVSQSDRPRQVLRVRTMAKRCAELYLERQQAADSRQQTADSKDNTRNK